MSFTIFVTHYPLLAQVRPLFRSLVSVTVRLTLTFFVQLEDVHPDIVGNYHMAFMEHEKERKEEDPNTT